MKILHTADWHLGKRLETKSRLSEQEDALNELNELCDREAVDIVIVAGDVFDTSMPSAEAEELFYRSAVRLAKKRPIVVLAGNHDDADRLAAPFAIAKNSNIYLVGGLDNTRITTDVMKGGFGWLRYNGGGETLNLAVLPFPAKSRLNLNGGVTLVGNSVEIGNDLVGNLTGSGESDKSGESNGGDKSGEKNDYGTFVSGVIKRCVSCFSSGVNVFASHLYMDDCLISDNSTGEKFVSSISLTKEILPTAHYCALGHIHKPQCVSKTKNAYYSGSLLKYHFDETDEKEFVIFDSKSGEVTHHKITSGKKLMRVKATNFEGALASLEQCGDSYVELIYESATPLSPAEAERIRSVPCLTKLSVINTNIKREVFTRHTMSDDEIFKAYYKSVTDKEPSDELCKAFMEELNS